jgi:hypothetical protein
MILYPIQSRPTVHFLPALAAAGGSLTPPFTAGAITSLPGLPAYGPRRFLLRTVSYTAVERLGLGFDLFADAAGTLFLGRYVFRSAEGWQQGGSGTYNFYVDGLEVPYYDKDQDGSVSPPVVHLALSNVDTVAKTANAGGAVTVTLWFEPMAYALGA